jgi:hypothetical protein
MILSQGSAKPNGFDRPRLGAHSLVQQMKYLHLSKKKGDNSQNCRRLFVSPSLQTLARNGASYLLPLTAAGPARLVATGWPAPPWRYRLVAQAIALVIDPLGRRDQLNFRKIGSAPPGIACEKRQVF